MKRLLALALVALASVAVLTTGCAGLGGGGPVATNSVTITASAFDPPSIRVKVGDTVTWTNTDSHTHNVTAAHGKFDSDMIQPKETFSLGFDTPGVYAYMDRYTPSMVGTITVTK